MRSHSSDRASYLPWERWRERFIFSTTLKYPSFTSHIQVSKYFQSCFKTCQHSQIPSEYLINFSIFLQFICQSTTLPWAFESVLCLHTPTIQGLWRFGIVLDNSSTSSMFMQTHHQTVNSIPCTRKQKQKAECFKSSEGRSPLANSFCYPCLNKWPRTGEI